MKIGFKALLVFFLFIICTEIKSQNVIEYNGAANYGVIEAPPGTYQLLTVDTKVKEVFTYHIATFVQQKRKQSQTLIIRIGEYSYVKIPSFNEINNSSFVPFNEGIEFVDYNYIFANYDTEK